MDDAVDFLLDEIRDLDQVLNSPTPTDVEGRLGDLIHEVRRVRSRAIELVRMIASRNVEIAEILDRFDKEHPNG